MEQYRTMHLNKNKTKSRHIQIDNAFYFSIISQTVQWYN